MHENFRQFAFHVQISTSLCPWDSSYFWLARRNRCDLTQKVVFWNWKGITDFFERLKKLKVEKTTPNLQTSGFHKNNRTQIQSWETFHTTVVHLKYFPSTSQKLLRKKLKMVEKFKKLNKFWSLPIIQQKVSEFQVCVSQKKQSLACEAFFLRSFVKQEDFQDYLPEQSKSDNIFIFQVLITDHHLLWQTVCVGFETVLQEYSKKRWSLSV